MKSISPTVKVWQAIVLAQFGGSSSQSHQGPRRWKEAPGRSRVLGVLCLGDVQWATDSGDRRRRGAGEGCIVPSDESTVGYLGALCWPTEGLHVPVHDQLLRTRPKY